MASIIRKLTENWKLKTLAFSIAVLLWVVVSAEQVTTNWIPVPVDVQVEDPYYRAEVREPAEVEVRFQGAGRDLIQVAVDRPPLRLVIPEVTAETGVYQINARMVQLSGQTTVSALDVRPSTVRVAFSRLDARNVPVRARITDALGPDWAIVDSVIVQPAQVRVTGPAPRLAEVVEIYTVPFELTPGDTVFQRAVPLDTAGLGDLDLASSSVTVSGRVDQVVSRTVQNVPVDVGPGFTVTPDHVDVVLRGPRRSVFAIQPATLRVAIAISAIPEQIPPEGISVPLRLEPVRFGVSAVLQPAEVTLLPREEENADAATAAADLPAPSSAPDSAPAGGE